MPDGTEMDVDASDFGPERIRRFKTADGYTLYLVHGAWVDDLLPCNVDIAFENRDGVPMGEDGLPLDGAVDAVDVTVRFEDPGTGTGWDTSARAVQGAGAACVWELERGGLAWHDEIAVVEYAMNEGGGREGTVSVEGGGTLRWAIGLASVELEPVAVPRGPC